MRIDKDLDGSRMVPVTTCSYLRHRKSLSHSVPSHDDFYSNHIMRDCAIIHFDNIVFRLIDRKLKRSKFIKF